jgi:hypothetical protein
MTSAVIAEPVAGASAPAAGANDDSWIDSYAWIYHWSWWGG